ncbi:MAG: SBBP repeat-containing protein [Gallionellaceae bacterium]|nr:SBBP repeat-containing protein [Gallionellaceae bacterium]
MRDQVHPPEIYQKIRYALVAVVLILGMVPTLSLAAIPAQEWVTRFNQSGASIEYAGGLVVDTAGNVYMTGSSGGDYATIKYDANGNQLWVSYYNGPANQGDSAYKIALDATGNVYVTGSSSDDMDGGSSYATIKYDASGNQLWVARHSAGYRITNTPADLAIDAAGNVYVTGSSYDYYSGYGASWFNTVKYDANGSQLWVARYYSPSDVPFAYASALAVDVDGNVYVTGESFKGYNYVYAYTTIKYSSTGSQLWVQHSYHGNGDFGAADLIVDAAGNVYVTGNGYATIKYDTNGNQRWLATYDGSSVYSRSVATKLVMDAAGNVYVTGYTSSNGSFADADCITIKYDAGGNQLWVAQYNGPRNGGDFSNGLAVDKGGNVYVVGSSAGVSFDQTSYDYFIVKFDANGNKIWESNYNGPGNGMDYVSGFAVNAAGNIYVTGSSVGSGTGNDFATIKYSQDTAAPSGTIVVTNGQTWTNTANVMLTLACTDTGSGCSQMQFSHDNTLFTAVQPYFTSKAWTLLSAGDGVKTVYVRYTDRAGNTSPGVSDTIILDTTKPVVSSVSATPDPFSHHGGQKTTIKFTLADNLSNTCSVKVKILNSSSVVVNTLATNVSCPASGAVNTILWDGRDSSGVLVPSGAYSYIIQGRDNALNFSAPQSGTVGIN